MYQPMNCIISKKHFRMTLWPSCDAQLNQIPIKRILNPLRYSFHVGLRGGLGERRWVLRINEEGRANIRWSNFVWKYLGGERRFEKKQRKPHDH